MSSDGNLADKLMAALPPGDHVYLRLHTTTPTPALAENALLILNELHKRVTDIAKEQYLPGNPNDPDSVFGQQQVIVRMVWGAINCLHDVRGQITDFESRLDDETSQLC